MTKTHVAWTNEDNVPDVTSPASNGELVFTLTTSGMLTCFDAKDGKKHWEHDFEMECHASPGDRRQPALPVQPEGHRGGGRSRARVQGIVPHRNGRCVPRQPGVRRMTASILRGVTNVWCLGGSGKAEPRSRD